MAGTVTDRPRPVRSIAVPGKGKLKYRSNGGIVDQKEKRMISALMRSGAKLCALFSFFNLIGETSQLLPAAALVRDGMKAMRHSSLRGQTKLAVENGASATVQTGE